MSTKAAAKKTKKNEKATTTEDNVKDFAATEGETQGSAVKDGQVDLTKIPASEFVGAFEGHVDQLTNTLWEAVLQANKDGVFVNRNIAASAFAEVSLRICVAQAKSIDGGVERFKQVLDL